MKIIIKLLFTLLMLVSLITSVKAQVQPTFNVTVRNCFLSDTLGGDDNVYSFDIWIQHTNIAESGPFELAYNQYYFNFNPNVANGGTLSYSMVPGSSTYINPGAIPRLPMTPINGNILQLASNTALGAGGGPIISHTFPGQRVITMKLITSANSFALVPLNLVCRNSSFGNPYCKMFAYINNFSTEITTQGTYLNECSNDPLPVELTNFNSNVDRNNVTLNWSTSTENNNSGFEIERKLSTAGDWVKISSVKGNGTTNEPKSYSFTERVITGKYNYRLKQLDFNGNYRYYNLSNEVEVGIPNKYNISQNYPNPFNPTTKIDYDISEDGKVNIVIYDISGRELITLVNEIKTAGYYTLQFNANNLASGIYFYRISSGNFITAKKMVILK